MGRRLHIGTFDDDHGLLAAVQDFRGRGIEVVDVISPYPVHGLDEALGMPRSRLPWVTLAGGVFGVALGMWFQYWASATDWPLDVGGKPFDSLPAFIVIGFEMMILFAGLATAGMLFLRCRLWPGKSPFAGVEIPGLEVTTDAGLMLITCESDARFRPGIHARIMREHGAHDIREEVER